MAFINIKKRERMQHLNSEQKNLDNFQHLSVFFHVFIIFFFIIWTLFSLFFLYNATHHHKMKAFLNHNFSKNCDKYQEGFSGLVCSTSFCLLGMDLLFSSFYKLKKTRINQFFCHQITKNISKIFKHLKYVNQ